MNTIFKHKILAGVMLCSTLLMASSCEDSESLKVTDEVPNADKTLYEVMTSDSDLSDFMEVVDSCGKHCADSLFNKTRVYTVWAPVNGFNKDSLIKEVQDGKRDDVFKNFVMAHVANHLRAANGKLDEENKILLLNGKVAVFEGEGNEYTFDGQEIKDRNIRVLNGVLHKISKPSEYRYNIWEFLKVAHNIDSVGNYLHSFNENNFNEYLSIKGPILNGQQIYLDSVFVFNNKWLTVWGGIGNLDAEDSLYTVYIPTNEVWEKQINLFDSYFQYNPTATRPSAMDKEYRDSLRNYYPRLNFLKYLTYSEKEQRYVDAPDSIMPAYRSGRRALFPEAQLEEHVIFERVLSNGHFKIIDEFPFTPLELFHDTVFLEGENTGMITTQSKVFTAVVPAYENSINKDSAFINSTVSGSAYYQVGDDAVKSAVNATYAVPNLLSAKYKVAAILVPRNITNSDIKAEELKPQQIKFNLKRGTSSLVSTGNITVDHTRVDTIFLTKGDAPYIVDIPVCEYYNTGKKEDYTITINIATVRDKNNNDTSLRLDKFMFIPVFDEE